MPQYRHRRSGTASTAFPTLGPGEIAVNTANRQIAAGDASTGAPVILLPIRVFDAKSAYAPQDLMVNNGVIYSALVTVSPGVFNAGQWQPIAGVSGGYVQKSGDTMSGALVLPADPTANLQAATKQYVDTGVNSKVARAGDTMSGPLVLPSDPATALQAATKQYVDAKVAGASVIYVSDTPPSGAAANSLWWNSANGLLFLQYNDGDSTQWVMAVPLPTVPDLSIYAPLDSPIFTGTPQAPTPVLGDNSTKLATTAFVLANTSGGGGGSGSTVYVSDTAPTTAADNSLWWDSAHGLLSLRYNDGDTKQWVVVTPISDPSIFTGDNGLGGTAGLVPAPAAGDAGKFLNGNGAWTVPSSGGLSPIANNTILGNNTGSSATPIALTATQTTAILNALVGDAGSGGTKGLAPAPATGDAAAGKFLKADATWATPAYKTPGGSNTQVQYNSSSNFGGIANLTTDGTNLTGARFGSAIPLDWDSGSAAVDTRISRVTAKVLAFGDSAAAGNNNGWIQWGGATRITGDVSVTSSTALATATGLSVNVQAGRTYSFDACLLMTCAAAGGVKAAIAGTCTATNINYTGYAVADNAIKGKANSTALAGVVASTVTTETAGIMIVIKGTITVNAAGTLLVQFSQNTSSSTATIAKQGSYFIVHDMR